MSATNSCENGSNPRFTHEVCRIWCTRQGKKLENDMTPPITPSIVSPPSSRRPTNGPQRSLKEAVCCLCGMGTVHNEGENNEEILQIANEEEGADRVPGLIKCAAACCNVSFHPMCALLASKLSQDYIDIIQNGKMTVKLDDGSLCQQYTLELMDVTRIEGGNGSKLGEEKTYIVPVGFCGLHNREREAEYYGCLPCSDPQTRILCDSMKIPYQFD